MHELRRARFIAESVPLGPTLLKIPFDRWSVKVTATGNHPEQVVHHVAVNQPDFVMKRSS